MPKGPKGDSGLSAYEFWKYLIASGNIPNPHDPQTVWPANKNSEVDYWDFLTGRDGLTPHVGTNGNWYIGDKDTGVKAVYFYIQRKMNPEDEWQKIPSYLPNSASRALDAYRVADKNSPQSIQMNQKLYSNYSYSSSSGAYYYYIYTYRFVQENPGKFKNNQATYWDGSDVYYTVKARDTYYGESIQWNGVCLLAPYQMGPLLKNL